MVYCDNAATTKMCEAAKQTMLYITENCWGNPSSAHGFGMNASEKLEEAREVTAECIGASAEEIVFTSCGSEANTQAILSAAEICLKRGKTHIISTAIEHSSVMNALQTLTGRGFTLTLLKPDKTGKINASDLASAINKDTGIVSIMHANNETGIIQPAVEAGIICRKNGILFHIDAVQTAGHIPVNVKTLCADYLSASGHKFGAAKGSGFLYVRKGIDAVPLIFGGKQENRLRAGTQATAQLCSLAAAFDSSVKNMENNTEYVSSLTRLLTQELTAVPGVICIGSASERLPGTVSFVFRNAPAGDAFVNILSSAYGIMCSSGAACDSGSIKPDRVLLSMGYAPGDAERMLRFSLNENNTPEEIKYISSAVKIFLMKYREIHP